MQGEATAGPPAGEIQGTKEAQSPDLLEALSPAAAERAKMRSMTVVERAHYQIKKAQTHLTAGANRLHGAAKSYSCMRPQPVAALRDLSVLQIVSGEDHLVAVDSVGRLWAWGRGESGQLGLGSFKHAGVPKVIDALDSNGLDDKLKKNLKQVECGGAYSAVLLDSGQLFTWGNNSSGQLGNGENANTATPRPLASMARRHIQQIACGSAHMMALTTARDLFTWGSNQFGQLGHGKRAPLSLEPRQVRVMSGLDVKQIIAGDNHSCVLTSTGDVYSWGRGDYGQLGHGNQANKDTPTLMPAMDQRSQAARLASGADFMVAVTYSGDIFSWGRNNFGQLGHGLKHGNLPKDKRLPDDVSTPTVMSFFQRDGDRLRLDDIVCGNYHVLAVSDKKDVLYAWGRGEHGQLGLDPRDCRYKATPQIVPKIQGMYIRQAAAGLNHSVLIVSPNATAQEIDVLTWGRGSYGQLGHGSGKKAIPDDALTDLRTMISSSVFSTNQAPRSSALVRSSLSLRSSSIGGSRASTSLGFVADDALNRHHSRPGPNPSPSMTRGDVTVSLVGYTEKNFARSLTGKGKRGGGDKVRPARPTSCDPRPSNMFRQRRGGDDRTRELSMLRHILAEPPSSRSVDDLRGDLLGASGTDRYTPTRSASPLRYHGGLGGGGAREDAVVLVDSLMTRQALAEQNPHQHDPPPLSMHDLLQLVDDVAAA